MSSDPFSTGVSALGAYSTAIDVAANNIANVGTAGFQSQDTEFGELYSGAVAARVSANSAQGGLQPAGSSTNVAISGAGYFVLEGPNGAIYTRAGNFVPGGNATLVDATTGLAVSSVSGAPITIPAGTSALSIGTDGTVTAILNGQATTLGRVALAAFPNQGGLFHVSGGYQASPNSGTVLLGAPATPGYGSLIPGFLEGSNVDLAAEIIKLTASQAAYKANAVSIRTADEILTTAINIDDEGRTA